MVAPITFVSSQQSRIRVREERGEGERLGEKGGREKGEKEGERRRGGRKENTYGEVISLVFVKLRQMNAII